MDRILQLLFLIQLYADLIYIISKIDFLYQTVVDTFFIFRKKKNIYDSICGIDALLRSFICQLAFW